MKCGEIWIKILPWSFSTYLRFGKNEAQLIWDVIGVQRERRGHRENQRRSQTAATLWISEWFTYQDQSELWVQLNAIVNKMYWLSSVVAIASLSNHFPNTSTSLPVIQMWNFNKVLLASHLYTILTSPLSVLVVTGVLRDRATKETLTDVGLVCVRWRKKIETPAIRPNRCHDAAYQHTLFSSAFDVSAEMSM